MSIRPINGMGEPKPVHECTWCSADTRGRSMHFVNIHDEGGILWLCDECWKVWK